MIGEWIRFSLVALCMLCGLFTLLTALIGLFRFDYALNRIHAAALVDTLGLLFFLLGTIIAIGFHPLAWKLVLVLVLQWLTSPLSSHMLSQFEYRADGALRDHVDLSAATLDGEDDKEVTEG